MNPAAESFVSAIGGINADTVFILPNNSNIILTAKQAASLMPERDIRIIETRSVGDGYAVLSMFDTTLETPEEVLKEAESALKDVRTGMISVATRDTEMDGVKVRQGDYIGFTDGTILSDAEGRREAALKLAEGIGAAEYDIALLVRGESVPGEEADDLKEAMEQRFPDLEIIPVNGSQPVYDYILVLE